MGACLWSFPARAALIGLAVLAATPAPARSLRGSDGGCFSGQTGVPGGIDTCAPFFAPALQQDQQRALEEMRRAEPPKTELKPLFVPPIVDSAKPRTPPKRRP